MPQEFAYEPVTVDDTAEGVGLTEATLNPPAGRQATIARLYVEAAAGIELRYTVDGTTVTTAVGTPASNGDAIELFGLTEMRKFRAIRTDATSLTLHAHYER